MIKDGSTAKLDAYLDPAVPEGERAALEAAVMDDPPSKEALAGLAAIDSSLKSLPEPEAPAGYFDGFEARVRAADPPAKEPNSGLHDLKALARNTVSQAVVQEIPAAADLSGMTRSSVVGMKVDVPIDEDTTKPPTPKWVFGAVGGLVVLGGAIAVMATMIFKSEPPRQVAMSAPAQPAVPLQPPPPPAPVAAAAPAAAPVEAEAAAEPAAVAKTESGKGEGKSGARERRSGSGGKKATASAGVETVKMGAAKPAESEAPAAGASAAAPAAKKPANDLDALLDSAAKPNKPRIEDDEAPAKKEKADEPAAGEVSISDLRKAMEDLQPKVRSCFKKFQIPGTADVSVVVAPTGKLTSSSLKGDFLGTPTGDCVLAAVKTGTFPKFKGSPMSLSYPFQLR